MATSQAIARVVYRMLKYKVEYDPLSVNKDQKRYEERQALPARAGTGEKTTRRRIRRWGCFPESVGNARTCPVHAVLGSFAPDSLAKKDSFEYFLKSLNVDFFSHRLPVI